MSGNYPNAEGPQLVSQVEDPNRSYLIAVTGGLETLGARFEHMVRSKTIWRCIEAGKDGGLTTVETPIQREQQPRCECLSELPKLSFKQLVTVPQLGILPLYGIFLRGKD